MHTHNRAVTQFPHFPHKHSRIDCAVRQRHQTTSARENPSLGAVHAKCTYDASYGFRFVSNRKRPLRMFFVCYWFVDAGRSRDRRCTEN